MRKDEKFNLKLLNKSHRIQREFNVDVVEDLQDIIKNTSDEQDPVSTLLTLSGR